jgi:two-component system chemotaxis sensor kinase CheA
MSNASGAVGRAAKDFLMEAEEITDQIGSELADLADMADSGEIQPDLLNSIFRGAHSLKGLAGMFGFKDISELSHNMENLLDSLRLGKINMDQKLVSVLMQSYELLASMVRSVTEGSTDDHAAEIVDCLANINSCLEIPDKPAIVSRLSELGLTDRMQDALTQYEEHRLLENLAKGRNIFIVHTSFDLSIFDQKLSQITETLKSSGEVISVLPSIGQNIETNIDFDILFGTTRSYEDLAVIKDGDYVSLRQMGSALQSPTTVSAAPTLPVAPTSVQPTTLPDKDNAATVPAIPPALQRTGKSAAEDALSAKSMSRTVRVDISKLDELMNIVGELALSHLSISTVVASMRAEGFSRLAVELGKAAKSLERKLTDLQKGVMEIRMIPVGQLYEKMSRIVRKISREQGKKVELKFYGADTELDKLIVEDISDPVMHIVRNALDHGIESPKVRLDMCKDETGVIKISAYQKGSHVVIEVEDDGSGINIDKLKAKALEKGVVQEISSLSDMDALDLIFLPGFSTSDKVSEVSGRGVGMDVVRNNITAISGMVDIETTRGKGTRFILTLPITLAIIKALIISSSGRTYAIPVSSVLESLITTDRDVQTVERKKVINLRETTLPLISLNDFFDIEHNGKRLEEFYVVVVGVAEKRMGIVVDDLLGQQDIVIKSLGSSFKRFRGIAGAADLGDLGTILVLDVGGILNEAMRTGN